MSTFAITSTTTNASLDGSRKASVPFTVTNTSGVNLRARASVGQDEGSQPGWFTIAGEAERDIPVDGTENYTVQLLVPPDGTPGDHRFQLKLVGTSNPDELSSESAWVAFKVPARSVKPFPWIWLVIPLVVLVLAVIGGGVWWFFFNQPKFAAVDRSPGSFAFGTVQVNSASASQVITVRNTGQKPAKLTLSLSGAAAADYQLGTDTCTGNTLAVNKTCTASVAFAPKTLGAKTAAVLFGVDSGPKPPPATLSGDALGVSAISFDPSTPALSINSIFAPPGKWLTSTPLPITVSNSGTAPLNITGAAIIGDSSRLAVTGNNCTGQTLQPHGSTCVITLQFMSSNDGQFSFFLDVVEGGTQHLVPVAAVRSPFFVKICTACHIILTSPSP